MLVTWWYRVTVCWTEKAAAGVTRVNQSITAAGMNGGVLPFDEMYHAESVRPAYAGYSEWFGRQSPEWLRRQSFVMPGRIATMGNSFGGIITVLAAERIPYCAVVDAAGGAQTWSPELSKRLAASVTQAQAPIFFFQAENDYDLTIDTASVPVNA